MKKKELFFVMSILLGLLFFTSCGREPGKESVADTPRLSRQDFSLEEKSREQLDYDQDGETEVLLIQTARYYDSDLKCNVVMDRMAVFEPDHSEGMVYSLEEDIRDGFRDLITYEVDAGKNTLTLFKKENGEALGTYSIDSQEAGDLANAEVSFAPFTGIETERGGVYLNSSIYLVNEDGVYIYLLGNLKTEILYEPQEDQPFSLRLAEQLELIAVTDDNQVAAYGTSPGAGYQEIVLDIEGSFYETDLTWHMDYRKASMIRADYDGDGVTETAFVYPYGVTGGTGIYHDELLMIDQAEDGNVFWQDVFPIEMWCTDEMEDQISGLLDWQIDKEQHQVYILDRSEETEMACLSYEEEEVGEAVIRGVFFTGHVEYVLEDGEIHMKCRPALSFEDRVTPCYLDGEIQLNVLYQGDGCSLICLPLKKAAFD